MSCRHAEEHSDRTGASLYRHHSYDVVNAALDGIALRVANTIQHKGFLAFPIPASKRASDELIAGVFSHKLAAHLAGLGWIGKSCLLVTPDHGPRVRWITVLTNAPIAPTGIPMKSRCAECTVCVDICPVHAFTGRLFCEDEPREARFDAAACDRYFKELEAGSGPVVCGLCLFVCRTAGRGNIGRMGNCGIKKFQAHEGVRIPRFVFSKEPKKERCALLKTFFKMIAPSRQPVRVGEGRIGIQEFRFTRIV